MGRNTVPGDDSGLNPGNETIMFTVSEMSLLFHYDIAQTAFKIIPFPEFNPALSPSTEANQP